MPKLAELEKLGQSVWFDFIRRSLITSGELKELIAKGVRGITSNPAIFEKAIAGSSDYDDDIKKLSQSGKSSANRRLRILNWPMPNSNKYSAVPAGNR